MLHVFTSISESDKQGYFKSAESDTDLLIYSGEFGWSSEPRHNASWRVTPSSTLARPLPPHTKTTSVYAYLHQIKPMAAYTRDYGQILFPTHSWSEVKLLKLIDQRTEMRTFILTRVFDALQNRRLWSLDYSLAKTGIQSHITANITLYNKVN